MTRRFSENAEGWSRVKFELLAVLEMEPAAARIRLAELATENPELAAEVAALFEHAAQDNPFLAHSALERAAAEPTPAAPSRVGPWRLEAEIGRGGMGTVWLGRRDDGAFEQVVAIKFVRPELATDLLRRRLMAERRLLAGLDHDNIARLLDGGVAEGGVPYLVLEYVDGEPIDAWCDHRELGIADRLRLFLIVCSAVEYAHRKLVLHRDIKSSNVLVDSRGRPKLLDFGIAKLLGPEPADEAWTSLGFDRPLTPEWASPEQLKGSALTTASDVYSLGVLLSTLLTGERPHHFTGQSPRDLAKQIEESGPVTARLLRHASPGVERRQLRGDLERILSRALAAEPERRYGTAAELALDLERFLGGRPVSAHQPSTLYRLRKFTRRNRAGVAAAALVVLSALIGFVATVRQARIAEAAGARAERRFADVRRLANEVLFEVNAALENVPGTMTARRLLIDIALRYLDDLAREAGDEPALLAELATAYERVGEMQGMPGWASSGHSSDALASFEQALALFRRSRALSGNTPAPRTRPLEQKPLLPQPLAAQPSPVPALPPQSQMSQSGDLDEARILDRIGGIFAARGETAAALARHRTAEVLLRRVATLDPTTTVRVELARVLVSIGDDIWELGDVPAAAEQYESALLVAQSAAQADPESAAAVRQAGVIEQRIGDAAAEQKDWPNALLHHAASLEIDRKLVLGQPAGSPENREVKRDLGTDLSRMGTDELAGGFPAAALAHHQEASRLRLELLSADPDDARAVDDLAESRLETGRVLNVLGRGHEALNEIAAAIAARRELVERDPGNVRWRDTLAQALVARAEAETEVGNATAAATTLSEVLAIRRRLAAESPDFASNVAALKELERHPPGA